MMALLAGSQLAINTLRLTEGSELQLSKIYPRVDHIRRFDLRSDLASTILQQAEFHLAVMAVPYVLALHEDYMQHCLAMLVHARVIGRSRARNVSAKRIHQIIADETAMSFDQDDISTFQLLRCLRNAFIHSGGVAGSELVEVRRQLTSAAEAKWKKMTGATLPSIAIGDTLRLGQGELIICLAVTKSLMKCANEILQYQVPLESWADRVIADALAQGVGHRGNPGQRFRKFRAVANNYYRVLGLEDADLVAAGSRAGIVLWAPTPKAE